MDLTPLAFEPEDVAPRAFAGVGCGCTGIGNVAGEGNDAVPDLRFLLEAKLLSNWCLRHPILIVRWAR